MRVLIVDDQHLTRKGIYAMIEWQRLQLTFAGEAENGQDAMEKMMAYKPDIVITDVRMPLMDGLELAEYIHHHHPAIKTLMVSGYDEFFYVKKALQFNVHDYILKPVNEQELNASLQSIIENKEPLSEEKWLYPVELEHEIIQAMYHGDHDRLLITLQDFFREMEQGSLSYREVKIWTSQLILQCCKTLPADMPGDRIKEGLLLVESVHQNRSLSSIRSQSIQYLSGICAWMHEQQISSTEKSIHMAMTYIDKHYYENLTLQQLATHFYMSPSQLSSLFKLHAGDTFVNYLTQTRLQKAMDMLIHTDLKVDKIAAAVGYPDDIYFRKLFKRRIHMTPVEFREKNKCD